MIPKVPDKWNTPVLMLLKLGIVAWFAFMMGGWTGINGAIWALVLGVIFTRLGFLDTNLLNRANSFQITMFALMMYVFDGLKDCTPAMLKSIIGPMVILIVIGVVGMAIAAFIISKILRMSFPLAFANGLTALYGFPCDAIITESTCNALGANEEERGLPAEQDVPIHGSGRIRDCNDYICFCCRTLRRNAIIVLYI